MELWDKIRGYGVNREVQAVFSEDGSRGPVHICKKYYDLRGVQFAESYGGPLTPKEERIVKENPELIKRSPFSWTPADSLPLPHGFARKVMLILEEESTSD